MKKVLPTSATCVRESMCWWSLILSRFSPYAGSSFQMARLRSALIKEVRESHNGVCGCFVLMRACFLGVLLSVGFVKAEDQWLKLEIQHLVVKPWDAGGTG